MNEWFTVQTLWDKDKVILTLSPDTFRHHLPLSPFPPPFFFFSTIIHSLVQILISRVTELEMKSPERSVFHIDEVI